MHRYCKRKLLLLLSRVNCYKATTTKSYASKSGKYDIIVDPVVTFVEVADSVGSMGGTT